jgi:hypothetical protein
MELTTNVDLEHFIEKSDSFLTPSQSKLLLAMFLLERPLYTKEFLEFTKVPHSTWSDAILLFSRTGLIVKEARREMSEGRVKSFAVFSLTQKGKLVAENLWKIFVALSEVRVDNNSNLLTSEANSGESNIYLQTIKTTRETLDEKILESIDYALESFGAQTKIAVQVSLALTHNVSWSNVPQKMQDFSTCLRERFGPRAAAAMETVITEELKNRLNLFQSNPENQTGNLSALVDTIRHRISSVA